MNNHQSSHNKNAFIVGCGSKFGKTLVTELETRGFTVYGISGSISTDRVLQIDWNKCGISDFEKFLRKLPELELVIFNQNSPALTEQYWEANSMAIFDVWKQSKQWQQSFYVNCILPSHIIHTLVDTNKINNQSCIIWMLSRAMLDNYHTNLDYFGQKYQNYKIMQQFTKHNPQTFVGVCPGSLNSTVYQARATQLVDLLLKPNIQTGDFFVFDETRNKFNDFKNI